MENTGAFLPKENELLKMLAEYKNDLLSREIAFKRKFGAAILILTAQYGCIHCQVA